MENNISIQTFKEAPTKSSMRAVIKRYLTDSEISPLEKYITLKAYEKIIEYAIKDTKFRKEVREDYLSRQGGEIKSSEFYGVPIQVVDQTKKNELAKNYIYTDEVTQMEKEIEVIEQDLKLKKDILKGRKLMEINNGTAKEVTIESVLGQQVVEVDAINNFELKLLFREQ